VISRIPTDCEGLSYMKISSTTPTILIHSEIEIIAIVLRIIFLSGISLYPKIYFIDFRIYADVKIIPIKTATATPQI
jgi:hypothetical protein